MSDKIFIDVTDMSENQEVPITQKEHTNSIEVEDVGGGGGISPIVAVEQTEDGHKVTITDIRGAKVFEVMNGKDGNDGEDGISATHSWNGTTLTITSANGSSSANLKGKDGDNGKSAYELAVANGYKGTITQWLESLIGLNGDDGVGISKIEKTTTNDKVDTYTITLTNGNTYFFTVTNGADGANGKTPYIQNGYWYIDGVNTNVKAKGVDGENGKDAYTLALDNGFKGTLAEWLESLKGKDGENGNDYVLTDADKEEIADKIKVPVDLSNYQTKTDENLDTNSKEVIGAINEINTMLHPITDLTGTTWVLVDNPNIYKFSYDVYFTSNGKNYYKFSGVINLLDVKLKTLQYNNNVVYTEGVFQSGTNWQSEALKTITFVGGNDATNANLIEYLNTNAKLQNANLCQDIKELRDGITGYAWKLHNTIEHTKDINIDFSFTSNYQTFDRLEYGCCEDDSVGNYYQLRYRKPDETYITVYNSYDGWSKGDAYKLIITDNADISLTDIATKSTIKVSEALNTKAKSIAGAINELCNSTQNIVVGYRDKTTGIMYEKYENGEFSIPIDIDVDGLTINIDLLGEILIWEWGDFKFDLTDIIVDVVGETKLGKWFATLVDKSDDIFYGIVEEIKETEFGKALIALIDEVEKFLQPFEDFGHKIDAQINGFIQEHENDTLATEAKTIPDAVNEVNGKVTALSNEVNIKVADLDNKVNSIGGVKNLRGTTWLLNADVDVSKEFAYNVDFTSNGQKYNSFKVVHKIREDDHGRAYYKNLWYGDGGVYITVMGEGGSYFDKWWFLEEFRTVTFTGGADITNVNLIEYLYANGDIVSYEDITDTLATVDKIKRVDVDYLADSITFGNDGIKWKYPSSIHSDTEKLAEVTQQVIAPIVAGKNVTFEYDEDNEVIKINATGGTDTSNLATVDKIKSIDTWFNGDALELDIENGGVAWKEEFVFYDERGLSGNELVGGEIYHRVPIKAGENVTFEVEGNIIKINAKGGSADDSVVGTWVFNETLDITLDGVFEVPIETTNYEGYKEEFIGFIFYDNEIMGLLSSLPDNYQDFYESGEWMKSVREVKFLAPSNNAELDAWVKANATKKDTSPSYIAKYVVELTGSEQVTDIIRKLQETYPDFQLGVWSIIEFTGASSGLYGLTIQHYGGNYYNISGMNFGTNYTMANNVRDWSQVSLWSFSGYFKPPIPYYDESNEGQILKIVDGVPTWVTP